VCGCIRECEGWSVDVDVNVDVYVNADVDVDVYVDMDVDIRVCVYMDMNVYMSGYGVSHMWMLLCILILMCIWMLM